MWTHHFILDTSSLAKLEWGSINTYYYERDTEHSRNYNDSNYKKYKFEPRLRNPLMANIICISSTNDVTLMLEYLTTSDEIST